MDYIMKMKRRELEGVFEHFDANGDGVLDGKEMQVFMQAVGLPASTNEVDKLLRLYDYDMSGELDFQGRKEWYRGNHDEFPMRLWPSFDADES